QITNAEKHEGYGLSHIIDKHPELDLHKIPEIIEKGEIVENAGVKTIIFKEGESEFRIGLSKGFNGKGENEWIVTAYERSHPAQNFDQVASKVQNGNNLFASGDEQIIQHT
ncbi:putative barnase/colicin E5 family endoribonuclease, partial [Helicobacter sp. T3_23-1059]